MRLWHRGRASEQRLRTRAARALVVVLLGTLTGCTSEADPFSGLIGHSTGVSGTMTFTGDLGGQWAAISTPPAICEAGAVAITIRGPLPKDIGLMSVSDDSSIVIDLEKYGRQGGLDHGERSGWDFVGSGGVFDPGEGFSVDQNLATLVYQGNHHIHVKGTLRC